ncbi:YjcZ family sporulation protein [Peribacillus sp. NPDC097295]|uniref:YjcZ family sporulation protein n=1 Tax=Peribacillus sp. NPDC097295 TaxID=3364402 RepID=UPI00382D93D9
MYYGGYTQDCCYPVSAAPSYGYGGQCGGGGCGFGSGFALIVVLFILLVIVGACLC